MTDERSESGRTGTGRTGSGRSQADRAEAERIAAARERQRELYGAPVGDRVRRITGGLGITQGRLAHALGLSPAMLSQLVSGRRVKIGDPAVLGRLMLLDSRLPASPPSAVVVDALLADVGAARPAWAAPALVPATVGPGPGPGPGPGHSGAGAGPDAAGACGAGAGRIGVRRTGGVRARPVDDVGGRVIPLRTEPEDLFLEDVVEVRPGAGVRGPGGPRHVAADALRAVTGAARLVAAAALLEPAFPELADVLRIAAVQAR
ncbi:helix-turn-helix domain-containing protein [Pseudonocardia sp. N23]|uniref:helix-turn-helix domain-containing protein n=1 Tax=Pseudonocardia sp. N23 TaxID=1987376 RepID=UPI000BFE10C8|nr:helix-turn-helix transcriptional regulator [Pseudonocardia sp. N23]GAY09407.1 putative DNA-binding protein [Pseudonocardia sp. N23]